MAQIGISLSECEIKDLIKKEVSKLTGTRPDELDVYITCWNGRLSTCTTHIDFEKDLALLNLPD